MTSLTATNAWLRFCLVIWVVRFLTGLPCGAATSPANAHHTSNLVIKVKAGGFGDANQADIQAVLHSVAHHLIPHYPPSRLHILVERSKTSPIARYARGPGGELRVGLNVEGRYWAQFAYQFAHELTHLLSNYEKVDGTRWANQWFLESACEAASVFAIGRMASQWKTNAPYPNWRSFSSALHEYRKDLLDKPERQLPEGVTLAGWYKANESHLRRHPTDREKNAIIALQILPLLEKQPSNWGALAYVNTTKPQDSQTFEQFLQTWLQSTPEPLRPFILDIAGLFGVPLTRELTP